MSSMRTPRETPRSSSGEQPKNSRLECPGCGKKFGVLPFHLPCDGGDA